MVKMGEQKHLNGGKCLSSQQGNCKNAQTSWDPGPEASAITTMPGFRCQVPLSPI